VHSVPCIAMSPPFPFLYRSEAFAEDLIDLPASRSLRVTATSPRRRWIAATWPALAAALGGFSLITFWLPTFWLPA